jgi:uncharacterized protein (TIGR03086 family)
MTAPNALAYSAPALAACCRVLDEIEPSDLSAPTPCTDYDIAALLDHLTRSMVLLAGSAGVRLEAPVSGAPGQRVVVLAEATGRAWDERGLDGEVVVGSRTRPAALAHAIVLLELVVHGWDLAAALGRPYSVDDEVVDHLLGHVPLLITPDKRGHGFAPEVPVPADAAPLARLIAVTGRAAGSPLGGNA